VRSVTDCALASRGTNANSSAAATTWRRAGFPIYGVTVNVPFMKGWIWQK
jgi:hypothetical protein